MQLKKFQHLSGMMDGLSVPLHMDPTSPRADPHA
jgi:hypothetical protein